MTEPVLIDARQARGFVELAALIAADETRTPDYREGAARMAGLLRLYLDSLIEDPAGDRRVAA